jgi:hypothetical protein
MGVAWKMPPLDAFTESLIHEQDKLIKMGALENYKAHVLTMHESNKINKKSKEKSKYNYCNRGCHPKIPCMKNTIDLMA